METETASFKPLSAIRLLDARYDTPFRTGPEVVLSSKQAPWRGLLVEQHRYVPGELRDVFVEDHLLGLQITPMTLEWRHSGRYQVGQLAPGDLCIYARRNLRDQRWSEEGQVLHVALDPSFVANVAQESATSCDIAFAPQHGKKASCTVTSCGSCARRGPDRSPPCGVGGGPDRYLGDGSNRIFLGCSHKRTRGKSDIRRENGVRTEVGGWHQPPPYSPEAGNGVLVDVASGFPRRCFRNALYTTPYRLVRHRICHRSCLVGHHAGSGYGASDGGDNPG